MVVVLGGGGGVGGGGSGGRRVEGRVRREHGARVTIDLPVGSGQKHGNIENIIAGR